MPLVSAFDAPTGDSYPAAFHVVTDVLLEPIQQHMTARVATYRDAAAAAAGRSPVAVRSIAWGADAWALLAPSIEGALANLQDALLGRPEFAGALLVGDDGQPLPDQPVQLVPAPPAAAPAGDVAVVLGDPVDDAPPEEAATVAREEAG